MFDIWEGRLMDEAGDLGGGGGDLAIADAGGDLDLGGGDDGDGGEQVAEETGLAVIDPEVVDPADGQVSRYAPTESNGRWSTRATKDLTTLRKTSPLLFQQIMRDRADATRLRAMAPADKKPFEYTSYLQKTLKDLGGEEGIQSLQEKSATFDDMDDLFTKGDPQVLDKYLMWDAQGTNAIMKLLPHVVARVEKLDGGPAVLMGVKATLDQLQNKVAPNAATKAKAEAIQATLNAFYIEYHVSMLASLLPPDSEIAKKSVAVINDFLGKVQQCCAIAPETLPDAPAFKAPEKNNERDQERQRLEQERTNFRRDQWRATSDADKSKVWNKAWSELTKGKKVDPIVREDVQVAISSRLMQAAKAAGLDTMLEGFFQKNDTVGYQRFLNNFYSQNIPRIMKMELEKRSKRGSSPAAASTPVKPGQPQQRVAPQQGFVKVASMPHSNEISHATTTEMIMRKQAMLKDGRKVFWV